MPQTVVHMPNTRVRRANAADVKRAAVCGDAIFAYFLEHGKLPESKEQLQIAKSKK
ncbi:hypothetical protein [Neptunomonas concharum]|uniref:hypothetical protein n=1 Tax=Neptunomonas concharum TaxID=1031538 RepID=UPI0014773AC7|nr:hypothetical protein [Neptunomonas concharum]